MPGFHRAEERPRPEGGYGLPPFLTFPHLRLNLKASSEKSAWTGGRTDPWCPMSLTEAAPGRGATMGLGRVVLPL